MPYDKSVFDRAHQILSARRRAAVDIQAKNRQQAFAAIPRLRQIDAELRTMGSRIAKAVLTQGGDSQQLLEGLQLRGVSLSEERAQLLRQNGLPEDHLRPQYTCRDCRDTGYLPSGRRCHCLTELLREVEAQRINAISSMKLSTFDSFSLDYYPPGPQRQQMEGVLYYCRDYAETFSRSSHNLLLMGPTGLGKTHLSLAIADAVVAQGYAVLYGSFANFAGTIEREKFGQAATVGGDTLSTLLDCDLLILDDVGSEFVTPFVTALLYNIVNTRLNTGRPTIISTNLTFSQLGETYSDRITSRLGGAYIDLRFTGTDVRLAKGRQR